MAPKTQSTLIGQSGRRSTVSLAVAASCVANASTQALATQLAGQIARAAVVFSVDEVIVLDDAVGPGSTAGPSEAAALLVRVLQYLETPQYLRRALVPMHPDLRCAGALPPLDAPHHLRADAWDGWREGLVREVREEGGSSYALLDVGLEADACVAMARAAERDASKEKRRKRSSSAGSSPSALPPTLQKGMRVTLRVEDAPKTVPLREAVPGAASVQAVYPASMSTPMAPRAEQGRAWGYLVRLASSLEELFARSSFGDAYDLSIGTSERGVSLESLRGRVESDDAAGAPCSMAYFPAFKRALVVFGGPSGLEYALDKDPWKSKTSNPGELFQYYLNTCPHQGSRTIRTEEAILISLAALREPLQL
ncbi:putative RNA methyltransferase [Helicosporidium sp. ATCC 50920]|nr:putative RNA methyltransferase [Helicosporidium sp. ATCC 50920]|eukprot:KDD75730.1 putative RNA methyltransferase [Helicosporidium sp. ATCC 50920]